MSDKANWPRPIYYVASRASIPERAAMWREFRSRGVNIVSSWIDEDGEGETDSFEELWQRIEGEIKSCTALILYAEFHDFPLKGALVEVGMAIAMGKPVLVFKPYYALDERTLKPLGSWAKHPGVMLMTIRIIKTPDIHITATELQRYRHEYKQAFRMYCGPKPDFEEWVAAQKQAKKTRIGGQ